MALQGYIPSFNLSGSDTREGDGFVLHSDTGHILVIDGFDGKTATRNLINYLKANNYKELYLLLSHPHYDHYKGLTMIMQDSYFTIKNFYCYDPESIKFGIGSSSNGRAVREDYNNFYSVINLAKSKGATVKYLSTGSSIMLGDIYFKVWRKQPTHFTSNDQGEAYAFINDGSLCLYFPYLRFLTTGDGPDNLREAISYFGEPIKFMKVPHHGNNCSESNAAAARNAGCTLAYETNIQRNGAGSTSFTSFGTRRLIQQGVKVLMSNQEISFVATNGKLAIKQGNRNWSFDIPYTGKIIPVEEKWIKGSKGWWYRFKDNTYATGWNYLKWSGGKNWFYFDDQGWMQTGWVKVNNNWYYCDPKTGAMQIGWISYKGQKCYLEPKTGNNQGRAYCNEIAVIDKKTYYFDKNCYARLVEEIGNWKKGTKGWWYEYLDGNYATGWQYLKWSGGQNWFYFDDQGWMQTGWFKKNGYWYYLNPETGAMETGWIIYKNKKCYLEPQEGKNQGHAYCNGTFTIDGKKYKFDKDCYLI